MVTAHAEIPKMVTTDATVSKEDGLYACLYEMARSRTKILSLKCLTMNILRNMRITLTDI